MAVRYRRGCLVVVGAGAVAAGLLVPGGAGAATATAKWGDFDRSGNQYNTLFPGTVAVSKGDKVSFEIIGFHTVVIPKGGAKVSGLTIPSNRLNPATNDPAGVPYWWGGTTPIVQANPPAIAPSGGTVANGSRTVNSGLVQGPRFTVTFPKTGTFEVRCAVHPNMSGKVRVVADSGDTAAKRRARAAKEQAAQKATVKRLVTAAEKVTGPTVAIGPGTKKAQSLAFHPANRRIAVGSTVTWTMAGRNELHTVTFGPRAFVQKLANRFFPTRGLDLSSEGVYPSDPPPAGVPSLTPTSHGTGFLNSGALADRGAAALPRRFSVTFPTAGKFDYICLVHPEMRASVTVS